jgi:D-alanyl-D-alanine carboxypeptidase (penicillin-binding protein 5/6)
LFYYSIFFWVIAMKRFFSSGLVALLLAAVLILQLLPMPVSAAAEQPEVDAGAAVLLDAESGNLLFSKNAEAPAYIAGLTVMMTALLAAESVESTAGLDYTASVTASGTFLTGISADASVQNIQEGEVMPLRDLLYCALIGAGSDACNVIGEFLSGGSISDFVDRMNRRAKELGCKNTRFANTHGLPDPSQRSTAHDTALIAAAFVRHPELMEIVNTTAADLAATNLSESRHLKNPNLILRSDYTRYYYSYANGIKSSYTDEAGYCLASAMKTDDSYVVSVVLGCAQRESEEGFMDIQSYVQTKLLFQWFSQHYGLRDVVNPMAPVAEVPVSMGDGADSVVVCADGSLYLFLPNDLSIAENFRRNITIYSEAEDAEPLVAPVQQGQVLGEMTVTDKAGKTYGPFPLVANTTVPVSRMSLLRSKLQKTFSNSVWKYSVIGLGVVLFLYLIFYLRYNIVRARNRRRRRQEARSGK